MGVFVLAGMEVQVEPPNPASSIVDVVHLDGLVPNRYSFDAFVRHAEELAGNLEETVLYLREREVRSKQFRIEVEVLRAHELRVEVRVPRLEAGRAGCILPLPRREEGGVLFRADLRGGPHLREELRDSFRGAHHLVLDDVVREALVSEDRGELVADRQEFSEDLRVGRVSPVQIFALESPTDLGIFRI